SALVEAVDDPDAGNTARIRVPVRRDSVQRRSSPADFDQGAEVVGRMPGQATGYLDRILEWCPWLHLPASRHFNLVVQRASQPSRHLPQRQMGLECFGTVEIRS